MRTQLVTRWSELLSDEVSRRIGTDGAMKEVDWVALQEIIAVTLETLMDSGALPRVEE